MRSRELDLMILMGPFQLEIFYDSMVTGRLLFSLLANYSISDIFRNFRTQALNKNRNKYMSCLLHRVFYSCITYKHSSIYPSSLLDCLLELFACLNLSPVCFPRTYLGSSTQNRISLLLKISVWDELCWLLGCVIQPY